MFTRETNLLLELFDKEIPNRRKLREAISRLSKAQESVVNGIIDICGEYRRNKTKRKMLEVWKKLKLLKYLRRN